MKERKQEETYCGMTHGYVEFVRRDTIRQVLHDAVGAMHTDMGRTGGGGGDEWRVMSWGTPTTHLLGDS